MTPMECERIERESKDEGIGPAGWLFLGVCLVAGAMGWVHIAAAGG